MYINRLGCPHGSRPAVILQPLDRRPTVLIVKDDALIALDLEGSLQANGYDVVWAARNQDALELVARLPFDCALLDLDLP